MYNETQQKGIITELLIATKFTEMGYIISLPLGNAARYDLIIDTGNKIYKVQCKTAKLKENGSYVVSTCNKVSTTTKRVVKHYTTDQIDFLASIIENNLIVIPVSEIETSRSKVFRVSVPKTGTKSTCNLIEEYSFQKFLEKEG